jgi:hypothetical protein
MSISNELRSEHIGRTLGGVVTTFLAIGAAIWLVSLMLGQSQSNYSAVVGITLAVMLGQYASFYHKSIVSGMSVPKFLIGNFVSTFFGALVIAVMYHYIKM